MGTTRLVFDCPVPPWVVCVATAVALCVVAVLARRDTARLRAATRAAVLALLALGTLMLGAIALGPRVIRRWRDPRKPLCLVLVDGSRSMLFEDAYDARFLARLSGKNPAPPGRRKASREQVVRLLLGAGPDGWLDRLTERFETVGWRFSDKLDRLPLARGADDYKIDERGFATALGDALRRAVKPTGGRTPRAVVVISDGAWNKGRDPSEAARVLGRMGVPVFAVGLGEVSPPPDFAVLALRAPQRALVGDEVVITAEVAGSAGQAVPFPVKLLVNGSERSAKRAVTPGGKPTGVVFSFVPTRPGFHTVVVSIPGASDEQTTSNNQMQAVVEVVEQKIRVLLVESEPRWEFRFLRNVLERDPSAETTVCLLRPGVGALKGQGYLATPPTDKSGLDKFDLVVLGDTPPRSLPEEFFKELVDFVRVRGGALIVIAGRRGNYRALAGTPVKDILPVILEGAVAVEAPGQPFAVELTQEGSEHLLARLAPDPETNERLWRRLPEVRWSAALGGLAPGATALLVHPFSLAGPTKLPLLAIQRVGAGKVMFLGTEDTWRWRREVGDKYHYRFWAQAVRWMVKKQFMKGDPRGRLRLSRAECDVGEEVEVEAFCLGPDGYPLRSGRVWVEVRREDGSGERVAMKPVAGGWGKFRAVLRPGKPGNYLCRPIVSIYGEEPLASEARLKVSVADLEKRFLAQDTHTLSAIAQASGGEYLRVEEIERLPGLLETRVERRVLTAEFSPCRHWAYYCVLAVVFASCWLLRKRSGLA